MSEGCKNCYAASFVARFWKNRPFSDVRAMPQLFSKPFEWKRPRKIFVNSMSDLFHEKVSKEVIRSIFDIMLETPRHTYQILTKRPRRMLRIFNELGYVPENVWLGVSAENQKAVEERIPLLMQSNAKIKFVSCEPLLGPVNLQGFDLDWVIVGGETGPHARPMHPAWVWQLQGHCVDHSIPFFFKSWGEWRVGANRDGKPVCIVLRDGRAIMMKDNLHEFNGMSDESAAVFSPALMSRHGKKSNGRTLAGREYSQFPERKLL